MARALNDYLLCEELGVLPCEGGLRDQPISVVLYFQMFRQANAEAQDMMQKELERK